MKCGKLAGVGDGPKSRTQPKREKEHNVVATPIRTCSDREKQSDLIGRLPWKEELDLIRFLRASHDQVSE